VTFADVLVRRKGAGIFSANCAYGANRFALFRTLRKFHERTVGELVAAFIPEMSGKIASSAPA
jgi:hypothetical protein